MRKASRFFLILLFISAFFTPLFQVNSADCTNASKIFSSGYDITVSFDHLGDARVKQKVSLKNLVSGCFASEYKLNINSPGVVSISGKDAFGSLITKVTKNGRSTTITAQLNDEVIGKNKTVVFELNYTLKGLAKRQGLLWNLTLPQVSTGEKIDSYNLEITVPASFGTIFSVSPQPKNIKKTRKITLLTYNKSNALNKNILVSFGEHQEISFTLKHQLENRGFLSKYFTLYFPADTHKQQILYKDISPNPEKLTIDKYGNYLAEYKVSGRQTIEVTIEGVAKIVGKGKTLHPPIVNSGKELSKLTESGRFIQTQDRLVQEKATELKSIQSIYDFVVGYLEYDLNSYRSGRAARKGAASLLRNNKLATNFDFVDLFLALTKAAGIPSREVFGFVLTDNSGFRPTFVGNPLDSLDLHVWAQVFNTEKNVWFDVDPTWGKTLSGDYIEEVFPDRFILLTSNFGEELEALKNLTFSSSNIKIAAATKKSRFTPRIDLLLETDQAFAGFPVELTIKIKNNSGVSLSSARLDIATKNISLVSSDRIEIPAIFPFETKEYKVKLRSADIFGSTSGNVSVNFYSYSGEDQINLSKKAPVIVNSLFSIGTQQILLSLLVFLLIIGAFAPKATKFFKR